jgi:predicted RNA binding protein YcfA (HicA-like mRNA interferase family)
MQKLKVLSGQDVLRILATFGFAVDSQCGSHVRVRRELASGMRQSLTVPLHREIDRGTLMDDLSTGSSLHFRGRSARSLLRSKHGRRKRKRSVRPRISSAQHHLHRTLIC